MTVARESHTATLLRDGRVLIAGGSNGTGIEASAELYDPSTGRFVRTGEMTLPRTLHKATLLDDGRVLIVGGVTNGPGTALLASAETYDPYTGTFTATGRMLDPYADTATLLVNGRVLITHSIFYVGSNENFSRHAELYDPATGSFTATGEMGSFHAGPTATLLTGGKVLVVGGDVGDGDGPSSSAELYNPDTGTFTQTGGLTSGREGHTATLLSNGTVLIVGGHGQIPVSDGGFDNLPSSELYDPASGSFSANSTMTTGRESHDAVLLASGSVLITGGAEYYPAGAGTRPPVYRLLSSAEVYTAEERQVPYGGTPVSLPGVIEAENFDSGRDQTAYHDLSAGNSGGAYRATDVDLQATSDAGGGYNVGWVRAGEWLRYSVNVATTGLYAVDVRVASPGAGGTFHVEVNGADVTGPVAVPATGAWQTWVTVSRTGIPLRSGTQVLALVMDTDGSSGDVGNFNWIGIRPDPNEGTTPYGGTPVPLPGVIEAENFDNGTDQTAYHDLSAGNSGGAYRATDVDLQATSDAGGGYNVGWVRAGEWLRYSVNVATTGLYAVDVRVASPGAGGTFHVEVNGADVTGPVAVPATGAWQTWVTVSRTGIPLRSGTQVLALVMDTAGSSGDVGNFNWIRIR
jgi:hypothetical protein